MTSSTETDNSAAALTRNADLRERLLDCYLNFSISKELSDWLQDLGEVQSGTVQEKLARIRRHAASLVLPAESFPRQTIYYLSQYDGDILSEICQELGLDARGSMETLFKRIYLEVGTREGWLRPMPEDARLLIMETFFPIVKSFDSEKDYYLDFWEEFSDLLGDKHLHLQFPLAHGRALVVVLIPELLHEAHVALLQEGLRSKGLELT